MYFPAKPIQLLSRRKPACSPDGYLALKTCRVLRQKEIKSFVVPKETLDYEPLSRNKRKKSPSIFHHETDHDRGYYVPPFAVNNVRASSQLDQQSTIQQRSIGPRSPMKRRIKTLVELDSTNLKIAKQQSPQREREIDIEPPLVQKLHNWVKGRHVQLEPCRQNFPSIIKIDDFQKQLETLYKKSCVNENRVSQIISKVKLKNRLQNLVEMLKNDSRD